MTKKIATILVAVVILNLVLVPIAQAAEKGGCVPCLVGLFFGPRAGFQYNDGVKIRNIEWITLVGSLIAVGFVFEIIQLVDVYHGRTWTEIAQKEALQSSHFDSWHNYAAITH